MSKTIKVRKPGKERSPLREAMTLEHRANTRIMKHRGERRQKDARKIREQFEE